VSGVYEGKSTGTPIGFFIENKDVRSVDYQSMKHVFRPSHADYTYLEKYGIRDYAGGGRASARETACRVVAGALAKQFLLGKGITINAFVDRIGSVHMTDEEIHCADLKNVETSIVRCPNELKSKAMEELIADMLKDGDSVGGTVYCVAEGVPSGLGEPVFEKLHAAIGKAVLSINAVKGFEIGSGFQASQMKGTEHNDQFIKGGKTSTNYSGGIQGGISNGMPIYFRTAFKPVATIKHPQQTINELNEEVVLSSEGRHDPCVVPRAVVIVEAMTAIVLMDFWLRQNAYQTNL
jgi:chorismate synthase